MCGRDEFWRVGETSLVGPQPDACTSRLVFKGIAERLGEDLDTKEDASDKKKENDMLGDRGVPC